MASPVDLLLRASDPLVRALVGKARARGYRMGPEEELRTQALVFFTSVLLVLGGAWGLSHLLAGRAVPAVYYFIEVLLVLVTSGFAFRSGELRIATHLILGIGLSSVLLATAFTGGLDGSNIAPFFMILIAPVFLLGSHGFWWAVGVLLVARGFSWAEWEGMVFPLYVDDARVDALLTWSLSGAVVVIFLAFYQASRDRTWHELQHSLRALQDSERKFRDLVESAHEAIVVVQDGHLVFHNPQLGHLVGEDTEALGGRVFTQLVCEEDQARVVDTMGRVLGGDQCPILRDVGLVHADGSLRWADLIVTQVPWRERHALLVLLADTTEGHETRAMLAEKQVQLVHAQKMEAVGRLAGGVAHDFNNQLTTMMGLADLLMLSLGERDPNFRDAQQIKQIAKKAANLTQQLLAFSRKQKLSPVIVDPNALVEDERFMLGRMVGEDVSLVVDLDPELPTVRADPVQLRQVLMNLVVNARDSMSAGGRVVISTHAGHFPESTAEAPPGDFACLRVRDTGSGMSPEVRDLVFEPFFTTRAEGTGLGLSVAYGIVHQHGGWIEVESTPGQGSTFSVYLPACDEEPLGETEGEVIDAPQGTGQRILVVEDADDVRTMATRFLCTHGYHAVEVRSAEEALALLNRDPHFSLVFTDVVLPGQTGIQLASKVLRRLPGTRVLLSSGYDETRSHWEEIKALRYPYVAKPYSVQSLLEAVHTALHHPAHPV